MTDASLEHIGRDQYFGFVLNSSMVDVAIVAPNLPTAKAVWFRTLEFLKAYKAIKSVTYTNGRELILTNSHVRVTVASEKSIRRLRGRTFDRIYVVDGNKCQNLREVIHNAAPSVYTRGGHVQYLDFFNKE